MAEAVHGPLGSRPVRIVIFIEQHHSLWAQPRIEEVETFQIGVVNVTVDVNKTEGLILDGLQRISKVAGHDVDVRQAEDSGLLFY